MLILFIVTLELALAAPPAGSAPGVPECRLADSERAQRIARWQRPFYRETALRAAAGGKLDTEVEDRMRAMGSDALYGRTGSTLARRNNQLLEQYAKELENLGLRLDSEEVEKLRARWLKASGVRGKVRWLPVKSFAKIMTGPELLRRCGADLLEPRDVILRPNSGAPVVMVCPGLLLKAGAHRFGPDVRPPVSDADFGADASVGPGASRDPLVVNLPTEEMYGVLADLFARASSPALPSEKGQVLANQVLRAMGDARRFKKPGQKEAWLRANRVHLCPDAPVPAATPTPFVPAPTATPLEPTGEILPSPEANYTPVVPEPTPTPIVSPSPVPLNTVN